MTGDLGRIRQDLGDRFDGSLGDRRTGRLGTGEPALRFLLGCSTVGPEPRSVQVLEATMFIPRNFHDPMLGRRVSGRSLVEVTS